MEAKVPLVPLPAPTTDSFVYVEKDAPEAKVFRVPRAVVEQLSEKPPVTTDGSIDWSGVLVLIVTLLGGGGAGWKAWVRKNSKMHQEQLGSSRRILADNEDQHRKLNNILDRLSEVLDKIESLEQKLPAPKKRKAKKDVS